MRDFGSGRLIKWDSRLERTFSGSFYSSGRASKKEELRIISAKTTCERLQKEELQLLTITPIYLTSNTACAWESERVKRENWVITPAACRYNPLHRYSADRPSEYHHLAWKGEWMAELVPNSNMVLELRLFNIISPMAISSSSSSSRSPASTYHNYNRWIPFFLKKSLALLYIFAWNSHVIPRERFLFRER